MRRRLLRLRRAEGVSEYAVILTLIMVCSVSTLISAGSRSIRAVAGERNLCALQSDGRDCDNRLRRKVGPDGEEIEEEVPEGQDPADPNAPADPNDPNDPNASNPNPPPPPPPTPTSWLRQLFGLDSGGPADDFILALFGIFAWF